MNGQTVEERDFFASLKDGDAVEMTILHGYTVGIKRTFAELKPRIAQPGKTGLLSEMMRPGVAWVQRWLELHYFKPFTPASEFYECFRLRWVGLDWSLTVFPMDGISPFIVRDAIEKAGLVAKRAAPAAMLTDRPPLGAGTVPSPQKDYFAAGFVEMDLPLERILYLENKPGHLIYRDRQAAIRQEIERMEALEREWEASR